ncbi:MAG: type II secretion system minor pseudopilin GspI [Endozoicomonadaceae bacterium]|nr:type II secretion system minor pseudopilin GspI [Endozoicomonadaceae bacterium]
MRNSNTVCQKAARGFTLLEVLIALAVFSIAAAALVFSGGQSVRHTKQVQDKILASQVAEEHLKQLYIKRALLEPKTYGQSEQYLNRSWYIQSVVTEWEHPSVYKVNIHIFLKEKKKESTKVYSLTGFVGKNNSTVDKQENDGNI